MQHRFVWIGCLLLAALVLAGCSQEEATPTAEPTEESQIGATEKPSPEPTTEPTAEPTAAPAEEPTEEVAEPTTEENPVFGTGIIYRWSSFTDPVNGETTIDESEKYTLSLIDEGLAVLGAPCRAAVGNYESDGSALTPTYDLPEKTDESCEEGPNAMQYFQLMQGAANYFTKDGRLYLDLMADGGTLAFDLDQVIDLSETVTEDVPTVVDLCGDGALTLNEIEATLDPAIVAALDEMLPTYVSEATFFNQPAPGVSLLVITPEGRYFKSIGVADVTSCEPLPADALFEIGSNTKMMAEVIIYQLQEEGVLSTTDPINQWLPEMAALVPNGDQMTIDMLLTHTNGIYDYLNGVAEDGPLAAGVEDKDVLTEAFTPEGLVELAMDSGQPYFEPGAEGQWTYSNTGYILLGLIIEAATGKTYEENLQERIFEPLELENTFLLEGQPEPGLIPQGYFQPPFDYTTGEWNATQAWSAGAVVSTAEDMAVFLKALFSGALFQDSAALGLMLEPAQPGYDQFNEDFYYGHGMFYKYGLLGHGGQALGFQSDVGYLPEKDATIVIWANSAENTVGQAAAGIAQTIGLIEIEE
jgi:D-alanyl-D-alanine carboxypeptidase